MAKDELNNIAQKVIDNRIEKISIDVIEDELQKVNKKFSFDKKLITDLLESIKNNENLYLKEMEEVGIKKYKFIENLKKYNLLISKVGETIESKYKEDNWDFEGINKPTGFEFFLESEHDTINNNDNKIDIFFIVRFLM